MQSYFTVREILGTDRMLTSVDDDRGIVIGMQDANNWAPIHTQISSLGI